MSLEHAETPLLSGESRQHQYHRHHQHQWPQKRRDAVAVRRRLTSCIFLYTVGASAMSQLYPKVILLSFGGDDGEASKYRGWLAAGASVIQLMFVPALSGSSDVVGRRALIVFSLALHAASVFTLASTASSLAWATVCRLVTSVCVVILPVSQAIMIDVSSDGGKDATHGLGIAFGAYALGSSAGDIVGGSLSEHHRGVVCLVSGGLASAALLSLFVLGWKETAPLLEEGRRRRRRPRWWRLNAERQEEARGWEEGGTGAGVGSPDSDVKGDPRGSSASNNNNNSCGGGSETPSANDVGCFEEDSGGSSGRRSATTGATSKPLNPLSVLKVFLESRVMLRCACSYFLFVLSLNVFASGYNYVDYRFHWTPPEISYFFATYNICMALAGGWAIRGIVPERLSEENGALFGISVQVFAVTVSGLCFRGWMLYPALAFGALQNITEPCLQAVMATFVEADRQGGLQGAVMSLRVIGEGFAAPLFNQAFSAGSSAGFEEAPFLLATIFSLAGLAVAWLPLRRLDKRKSHLPRRGSVTTPTTVGYQAAADGTRGIAEERAAARATNENGGGGGCEGSDGNEAKTSVTVPKAATASAVGGGDSDGEGDDVMSANSSCPSGRG